MALHRKELGVVDTADSRPDAFDRGFAVFRRWVATGCNIVGTIGLALIGAANPDHYVSLPLVGKEVPQSVLTTLSVVLFVVGTLGLFWGELRRADLGRRLRAVESTAATAEDIIQTLPSCQLGILARSLNHYSSERVNLFVADGTGFALVGRWSANPSFTTAPRSGYPFGQGCVGAAWDRGSANARLPDPSKNLDAWLDAQVKWQTPRDVAASITMKSRTYVAIRINAKSVGRQPLGVIVFESDRATADMPTGLLLAF